MSLDFSKAFNRVDHGLCLKALALQGASEQSCQIVQNFLAFRSMRVRRGLSCGDSLEVKGGAPQGSILGTFLFCATANLLEVPVQCIRDLKNSTLQQTLNRKDKSDKSEFEELRTEGNTLKFIDDYNTVLPVECEQEMETLHASRAEEKLRAINERAQGGTGSS